MMVDFSEYDRHDLLLVECEESSGRLIRGYVIVNSAADDTDRPHSLTEIDGASYWVSDNGATVRGITPRVKRIICEMVPVKPMEQHFQPGEDITADKINEALNAALRKPSTPTDQTQQLLDNLFAQNAALTKIIADYMAGRCCN